MDKLSYNHPLEKFKHSSSPFGGRPQVNQRKTQGFHHIQTKNSRKFSRSPRTFVVKPSSLRPCSLICSSL
uniref:Uncharacterized protein n=1 Tax=Cannabis sativa TaxID=3483 RepID=A0A803QZY9_CANSA